MNFLPGPAPYHPHEVTTVVTVTGTSRHLVVDKKSECHLVYRVALVPIVSTITGGIHALIGLVHAIVHLSMAIFKKNREHHLNEACLGLKHAAVGVVSMVPIIGNIAVGIFCVLTMANAEKKTYCNLPTGKYLYFDGVYNKDIND